MKLFSRKSILGCGAAIAAIGGAHSVSAQARSFNLPAEDAVVAIPEFARQAGIEIIGPAGQVKGIKTPAVNGMFEPSTAMKMLLQGTGLEVASDNGQVVVLRQAASPPQSAAFAERATPNDPSERTPHGQKTPTPRAAEPAGRAVEELIVTATRRETNLESTPISINAISAAQVKENRVVSVNDIAQLTPGFVFVARNSGESYLSIRGAFNQDDSTGADMAISMFVDDVSRISPADLQPDLFDLDRVEVLKGPQGTTFGRNTIGGVISLYTKRPTLTPSASLEATYGVHNLRELKGVINGPLISGILAGRFVFSGSANDGNIKDVTTGAELGGQRRYSARGELLYTPASNFDALAIAEYQHVKSDDAPGLYGNFQPSLYAPLSYNPDITTAAQPELAATETFGLTGRADWTLDFGTLTSITSYRHLTASNGTHLGPIDSLVAERDSQSTQEFRLASPVGQRLSWIVGSYFLSSDRSRPGDKVLNILPGTLLARLAAFPSPFVYSTRQNTRTISAAPFVDVTYALTPQVTIDAGARYTWEKKSGFSSQNPAKIFSGPPISASYSHAFSAFTPKLTISYQPTDALFTYATVSRGFQSGGFNVQGNTAAALSDPFQSEYVTNYEIGEKFRTSDGRLQINVSGFVDKYTQLQIVQYDPVLVTVTTQNAGSAVIKGIETDIAARPVPWLLVGLKYDYLSSKFTEYRLDNGDGTFTDNTGNKVPYTPEHRLILNADTNFDLSDNRGALVVGGDYTYRSSQEIAPNNVLPESIRQMTEWRGVVNLHANWTSPGDRWEVSVWAKNVTDRRYALFGASRGSIYATLSEYLNRSNFLFALSRNPAREYGVTVRANF